MSYSSMDAILQLWATKHSLHLFTSFKDEEVRSTDVFSASGAKCQIWIDLPGQTGTTEVHVWDYKRRRNDLPTPIERLPESLEEAYAIAVEWLGTGTKQA
jgi:hypothetical protein